MRVLAIVLQLPGSCIAKLHVEAAAASDLPAQQQT